MHPRWTRTVAFLALAAALLAPATVGAQDASSADPWSRLPGILAGIKAPVFPARDFLITDFGAKPATDASGPIAKAIAACVSAGGGRVVVPPGEFLTGPIHLKSGVNLHVQKGATLRFSTDPSRYLPLVKTRFEGVEMMNYSPLIYALGERDIAVTGEGTLDGQASEANWWQWRGPADSPGARPQTADRARLFQQAEDGVPVAERVYGAGHFLRPSFIEPYESQNVLIEGVTIRNAPFWVIHPTLSRNVTIRGVTVISHGPNNDGADPESSTDVLIEGSTFDTGDDCIAIKSGRNADGRRVNRPSERIVVRNSTMRAGHGGLTIGSEVSGSVRDVFVLDLAMSSPDLERGIRLKSNAVRGGVIENVFVRDVEIGEVGSAIDIDLLYEEGARGSFTPVIRNIRIERLHVKKARYALFLRGLLAAPVRGVTVLDSSFGGVTHGVLIQAVEDLVLRNVTVEPVDATRPGSQKADPVTP